MADTKFKCPYRYPKLSRRKMAYAICDVGQYYGDSTAWPIAFNVSAEGANLDFDSIWATHSAEFAPQDDPAATGAYYELAKSLYPRHEERLFEWGVEEAARSLKEDDLYRTLWDGTTLRVRWDFYGRGGKHLILSEFNGHSLRGLSQQDLINQIMSQTNPMLNKQTDERDYLLNGYEWDTWATDDVLKLYMFICQCKQDLTPAKAAAEVAYQGGWQFFANIVDPEWERYNTQKLEKALVVSAARTVREALPESLPVLEAFNLLLVAAGVGAE